MTRCNKCGIDPDEVSKKTHEIAMKYAANDLEYSIQELLDWWRGNMEKQK